MIMMNQNFPEDDKHRSEPEIIPPGKMDIREMEGRLRGRVPTDAYSFHRVYISRTGPFGLLPFFLLAGVIGAVLLIFMASAFLILIPVAGVILAASLFAGLLRGRARWPR
jgi:hypothetical protein